MPVVIAEVFEILDTPFSSAATLLNICVIVLALVIYITNVIVGNIFSILDIDIASVFRYVHSPVDSLRDKLSVQLSAVYEGTDVD